MSGVVVPLRSGAIPIHSMSGVHLIRNVLARADCDMLCKHAAASRHHSDDDPIGIRKNLRLPMVASKILGKVDAACVHPYRPTNIDEMMRLYRLENGAGAVGRHVDDDFVGPNGSIAKFSVLVYLNSGFEGGTTIFHGFGLTETPAAGDAYLFRHDIPHEGLPVRRGVKFVLKTDLFVES